MTVPSSGTGTRSAARPRYVALQQSGMPLSWAPYDEYNGQLIRPAELSQREAETLADRLNSSGVDWIPDDERGPSFYWSADRNDGHYPDDSEVWVRHPLSDEDRHDRDSWSWLTGWIISQVGSDEWHVAVDDDRVIEDPAQDWVPACFRDSTELRPRFWDEDSTSAGAAAPAPNPGHSQHH